VLVRSILVDGSPWWRSTERLPITGTSGGDAGNEDPGHVEQLVDRDRGKGARGSPLLCWGLAGKTRDRCEGQTETNSCLPLFYYLSVGEFINKNV